MKKGKKRIRKKIKITQPTICHQRKGNENFFTEEVVGQILEKILSYSETEKLRRKITTSINDYCFNHMKREISNFMLSQYISYDKDDLTLSALNPIHESFLLVNNNEIQSIPVVENKLNINDNNEEDEKLRKINDVLPKETNMHVNFFNDDKKIFYDASVEDDNFWGDIILPKTAVIDRHLTSQMKIERDESHKDINEAKEKENENNNTMLNNDKSSTSSLKKNIKVAPKKNRNVKLSPLIKKDKPRLPQLADFPSKEIPVEKLDLIPELPNIDELRAEQEKYVKKNHEIRQEEKRREVVKQNLDKALRYNPKSQRLDPITSGPSGEVIKIKVIPADKFENEFKYVRSELGFKKSYNNNNPKGKKKKKGTNTNNLSGFSGTVNPSDIESQVIEYNTYDREKEMIKKAQKGSLSFGKSEKRLSERIGMTFYANSFGNSFNLMTPEIGVVVKENDKVKNGGKDFFQKYNRYSVENFNKTVKASTKNNIFNIVKDLNNGDSNNNNVEINSNNNVMGGTQNINNVNNINANKVSRNIASLYENNKNNFISEYANEDSNQNELLYNRKNRNLPRVASTGNMIMTSYKFHSIKDAINQSGKNITQKEKNELNQNVHKDYDNEDEQNMNTNKLQINSNTKNMDGINSQFSSYFNPYQTVSSKENLFKNIKQIRQAKIQSGYFNKKRNINEHNFKEIDEMAKFAKTLMGPNAWGNIKKEDKDFGVNNSDEKPREFVKPMKWEINREVGMNIMKLPRERMKASAKDILLNGGNKGGTVGQGTEGFNIGEIKKFFNV